jgi:hypothetical protein
MERTHRGRSFDAMQMRERPMAMHPLMRFVMGLALLPSVIYLRTGGDLTVLGLMGAGCIVAFLISKEMRGDFVDWVKDSFRAVRGVFAGKRARRTLRGRMRVLTPVLDPETGTEIAGYFIADASPRERWWSGLQRLLAHGALSFLSVPEHAIRSDLGEVFLELEDGRIARIDTEAVMIVDRRRVHFREPRRVVIHDGDLVDVDGACTFDEATSTFVYDGADDSFVEIALIARTSSLR